MLLSPGQKGGQPASGSYYPIVKVNGDIIELSIVDI
jgi:hypothetical protein